MVTDIMQSMKSKSILPVPQYVRPALKFIKIFPSGFLAGSGITQEYEEEDIFGD